MTRALWVTVEAPDRGLGGGSIRQAHLLEALAGRVETHLVLVGRLEDPLTRARLAAVTEVAPPPERRNMGRTGDRLVTLSRAVLGSGPDSVAENRPHRRLLAPLVAGAGAFDLVCVEHGRLAPVIGAHRHRSNRWVLTLHNLASEQAAHALALSPGGRQRWLAGRQRETARRFELAWAGAYDRVVVTSGEDAAALGTGVAVVPNGVDTAAFRPSPVPREPRLVFTAVLHWLPNVEGIEWFCSAVWPRVQAAVPSATLDIVGRQPVARVGALAGLRGVRVHPDVASVAPFLARARVAVVPVRIGSGTRLKALEALAAGRPVVGTTIGLAGLGLEPGRHALVADDPAVMADAILAVLGDDALAGRLAGAGRALVEARYSWERVGAQFLDAVLG